MSAYVNKTVEKAEQSSERLEEKFSTKVQKLQDATFESTDSLEGTETGVSLRASVIEINERVNFEKALEVASIEMDALKTNLLDLRRYTKQLEKEVEIGSENVELLSKALKKSNDELKRQVFRAKVAFEVTEKLSFEHEITRKILAIQMELDEKAGREFESVIPERDLPEEIANATEELPLVATIDPVPAQVIEVEEEEAPRKKVNASRKVWQLICKRGKKMRGTVKAIKAGLRLL